MPMVDRDARNLLRAILDDFRTGAMTNTEALCLLDDLFESDDEAVCRLVHDWSFALDDPFGKEFTHQTSEEEESDLARDIAFLASDLPHPCEARNAVMSPRKKACLTLLMIGVPSALFLLFFVGRVPIALLATIWVILIVPWRSLLGKRQ